MSAPRSRDYQAPKRPSLNINVDEATKMINDRILFGEGMMNTDIRTNSEYERFLAKYTEWDEYNEEMLNAIFDNNIIALEYRNAGGNEIIDVYESNFRTSMFSLANDLLQKLDKLSSIKGRLALLSINMARKKTQGMINMEDVFIVHGHDDLVKTEVARFLEKLNLHPIILHEQANSGMTVIEKLEAHSDVGYAIILLTPDDEGKSKKETTLLDRARQNVIVELGYFVGKIGRSRVCPLYVDGVEVPSDFSGVVYTPYDPAGGWKFKVCQELISAGFHIDTSNLFN